MSKGRQVEILEQNWRFFLGELEHGESVDLDDRNWQIVQVPHDWAIEGPFSRENDLIREKTWVGHQLIEWEYTGGTGGLPHVGKAWYRYHFTVDSKDLNRIFRIEFDGVMSHAQVYCNGSFVGTWPYGYASFAFDLAPYIQGGENVLAVFVDNKPCASRWYPGAGIYRFVRLVKLHPIHVAHWGIWIRTPHLDQTKGVAWIRTELEGYKDRVERVVLEQKIVDQEGAIVSRWEGEIDLPHLAIHECEMVVAKPIFWSVKKPYLYRLITTIQSKDHTIFDQVETRFGFRTLTFDAKKGFSLNGEPLRWNGVCLHHDLGPLGAAIYPDALKRQLRILKEMGCNAIRTSHNPPAPELLDLADEMGFLVIDEAFDEWRRGKRENGYHILFDQWAEKDLRAMIRRDRNHPSVMMWSLGNEVIEQDYPEGAEVIRFLHQIAHEEDPTRPTTAAFNNSDGAIRNGMAGIVDVPGWNYKPRLYAKYRAEHPDWPMYGSETASAISSRGQYYLPAEDEKGLRRPDLHVNSFDLSSAGWAYVPDVEFSAQEENPSIMGEFVWTGFDYLGEPTPYGAEWPSRSSYFGIVDLCGIPKDRYYLYQSVWAKEKGTLHLLPHWNWEGKEGYPIPVHCYSAWDTVELFLNGRSLGKKTKDPNNLLSRYRLVWHVPYEPGELKAVAYNSQGKPVKETIKQTAGEPKKIRLTSELGNTVVADGKNMVFILVEICDAYGVRYPTANHRLQFEVKGDLTLLATDNGDQTSTDPFKKDWCRAFNGCCMLYLITHKRTRKKTATIRAFGEGLESAELVIKLMEP